MEKYLIQVFIFNFHLYLINNNIEMIVFLKNYNLELNNDELYDLILLLLTN